jgi:hypothetical protein
MMFRTAIRELTVKELTGLGRFERVFNARAPGIGRADLPACKVWTPDDSADNLSIGNPELRGNLSMVVQVVTEGVEDEQNIRAVDDLCEAVMHQLLEDGVWLQYMDRVLSVSTSIESNTEGEMRTVTATIAFQLQYADIYVTRIIDYLDREHYTLPVPGQPEPPPGEDKHAVEFEVTYPRWPLP